MKDLFELAEKVIAKARQRGVILVAAESCTGGMVATALTAVAGSSNVFDRSFVTYSYDAKEAILGVKKETLTNFGAVSEQCVEEMAAGAVRISKADLGVSISGIAGPSGGTPNKPVGLVYFGYHDKKRNITGHEKYIFSGDRHEVRVQSSAKALEIFLKMMEQGK